MRLSQFHLHTSKETPADAEIAARIVEACENLRSAGTSVKA